MKCWVLHLKHYLLWNIDNINTSVPFSTSSILLGGQSLVPAASGSSKFTYRFISMLEILSLAYYHYLCICFILKDLLGCGWRSLLASIIQSQDIRELSAILVVVSEASNDLAGIVWYIDKLLIIIFFIFNFHLVFYFH